MQVSRPSLLPLPLPLFILPLRAAGRPRSSILLPHRTQSSPRLLLPYPSPPPPPPRKWRARPLRWLRRPPQQRQPPLPHLSVATLTMQHFRPRPQPLAPPPATWGTALVTLLQQTPSPPLPPLPPPPQPPRPQRQRRMPFSSPLRAAGARSQPLPRRRRQPPHRLLCRQLLPPQAAGLMLLMSLAAGRSRRRRGGRQRHRRRRHRSSCQWRAARAPPLHLPRMTGFLSAMTLGRGLKRRGRALQQWSPPPQRTTLTLLLRWGVKVLQRSSPQGIARGTSTKKKKQKREVGHNFTSSEKTIFFSLAPQIIHYLARAFCATASSFAQSSVR